MTRSWLRGGERLALLFAAVFGLSGCAIGIMDVDVPPAPPPAPLPIERTVYFDICGADHDAIVQQTQRLKKEYGLDVYWGEPEVGQPYVHLLFLPGGEMNFPVIAGMVSLAASFVTFGALPGYLAIHDTPRMQLTSKDATGKVFQETFQYPCHLRIFLWAPLIVYPDIYVSINGGYINQKKEALAMQQDGLNYFMHATKVRLQNPPPNQAEVSIAPLSCPER